MQRPVATEHGHIFSKEAILSYYLDQRKELKQKMKDWEAEQVRFTVEVGSR